MARYINPVTQYTDSQGALLVEGFLRYEESGTNTLKPIYADVNLQIPLTNPVKLDGAGRVPSLFLSGSYKVTAFKNDGVGGLGEQQWERDPVGGETGEFGGSWDAVTQYSVDDIVRGSDDKYYQSIASNNTGNDPISTPSAWSELNWFTVWNTSQTYAQFDNVKGSDGIIYYSVLGSNLGNDPVSDDGTNWLTASTPILDATDTIKGVVELATQAEVNALSDTEKAVTPGTLPLTSDVQIGLIEIATQSETDAGTDTSRAITPSTLKNVTISAQGLDVGKVATQQVFKGFVTAAGSGTNLPSGWSVNKVSTGTYDVTTNLGTSMANSNTSTCVTVSTTTNLIRSTITASSGIFRVLASTTAASVSDNDFHFIVVTDL